MKLKEIYRLQWIIHSKPYTDESLAALKAVNYMYEGLIVSQPGNYLVGKLKDNFQNISIRYTKEPDNTIIKFTVIIKSPSDEMLKQLLKLTNNYGWFFSQYWINNQNEPGTKFNQSAITDIDTLMSNNQLSLIILQCEAKFDVQIDSKFLPPVLFHAAPTKYINRIQKIGLILTSKNSLFSFPDRIYLAYDINDLEKVLVPYMANKYEIANWTIFKVDSARAKNETVPQRRWFKDPNYSGGFYTMTNIRPSYLTIIKQIEVPL